MRGYFGFGVEKIAKPVNIGSLFRSAHAFGASFVFTIDAAYTRTRGAYTDTSKSLRHLPFYRFPDVASMVLPDNCTLVGVELTDNAIELPRFDHPLRAAYVLGPERASLSAELSERCEHIVKIPTRYCINVAVAGAVVMYDRVTTLGKFLPRPVSDYRHAAPKKAGGMEKFASDPPLGEAELSRAQD